MNPGGLVQISLRGDQSVYQVHSCLDNTCLVSPVDRHTEFSRLILVNDRWVVEGAETVPYQIQILTGLTNPYVLESILLKLDLPDLQNLCLADPQFEQVCKTRGFWEQYYRQFGYGEPAEYPSPLQFYTKDFLAKRAEAGKWENSKILLRDLGMPQLDLEDYLKENVYPSWLEQVQAENEGKPIKFYSAFESYEQGADYQSSRSRLEAGITYLIETGFPGFYDEFYDRFEEQPDLTLGELIQLVKGELLDNVLRIELEED